MARKKSPTADSGATTEDIPADAPAGSPTIASAPAPTGYVVLARKYRPQTFEDLIGQDAMVTTLRNAFAQDRIAQGYMLTGVRGVGKTTTARILARALNYSKPGLPDRPTTQMPDLGEHCREIMESRHPDVIEMDAASNTGVDNIREIIESARYRPLVARTKVFIIDEVHMLSKGAFNALLKTLEEPPPHVKFIFATTEIRKVPVTVLSRCQRFDLRRVDVAALVDHFRRIAVLEGVRAEDDALTMIARAAEGSVRDGLSVLDQAIATGQGVVAAANVRRMLGLADRGRLFDLLDDLFKGAVGAAVMALSALHRDGADPVATLGDLAEAVHIATRFKTVGPEAAGEGLSAEERRRAAALAARLSLPVLSRAWQMLFKGYEEAARAPDAQAAAEMVLIRIAHAADLPSPEDIIRLLGGVPARRTGQPAEAAATAGAALAQGSARALPHDDASDPGEADEPAIENDEAAADTVAAVAQLPDPRSFGDVVELAGIKRDARLKVHLEEHVSLVKFDPAGSIELHLLPGAPAEIANELREKLNRWTGRRWIVAVSKTPGEAPIAEAMRAREAAELAVIRAHPAVEAVLEKFPGARIASVRPARRRHDDDQAAG